MLLAGRGGHAPLAEVDGDNVVHLHIHIVMAAENVAEGKRRIAGRKCARCHLIKERLELLIVIPVDERNPHIGVRRELGGALQSRKASAHNDDVAQFSLFLIFEVSQSVLGTFAPASQEYAATALREHGVDVRLGVAVTQVTPDAVTLSDGSHIPTKTVVWAAGLKAAAPPQSELSRLSNLSNGRVEVEADLSVRGLPGVYVLGDLANSLDDAGKALPQLAAVAKQAGEQCARNILAAIAGKPSRPFVYSDRGTLAMIGRNAAVAELGKTHHELVGPIAFAAWLGVHAVLLTAARARLEAIVEWAWEYFTGEHPSQLIDR